MSDHLEALRSRSEPRLHDVPERLAAIEAELLAPGGPFETEEAEVLGERMRVFRNRARSLREHLARSADFGEAVYLIFSDGEHDRRLTFAEHERLVASTAVALREQYGVGKGDRVAILGANAPEWIVAFWAAVSLGAVPVACNGWWTGPEIRFALDDCDPAVLVADARRLERLDGDVPVPFVEMETGFNALWHRALDTPLPDTTIDEDDPALILYTSGTTGRPKGAVHSHRNVNALLGINFFHGLRMLMLEPASSGPDGAPPLPSVQLVTSPLFHVSGLHNGAVAFLAGGVTSVWTVGRFDPVLVMGLIERDRVTGWSFTETMLRRVVEHPDVARFDLSSIRSGGGGGSPFAPALLRRAREVMPGLRPTLGVGYGLTECSALATLNSGAELERHPDSVGRPLPTVELEIRDPSGCPVGDAVEGEVHLRGPMVMLGYWCNPGATSEVIGPGRWLRTGDVGRMRDGRLFLASRKRDLILRGGENVYPVEIEQRLEEHPAVVEAAAVGVPDVDLGQVVMAHVVLAPGADAGTEELARWCADALAYFKVPAHWELRAEPLPRNAAGKVMKQVLVDGGPTAFVEE